jgi:hypothetical protein
VQQVFPPQRKIKAKCAHSTTTQAHNNQNEPPLPYPLAALPSLSMARAVVPPNHCAAASYRLTPHAIGFGGTAVSSPVWGANTSPIKNGEEGGALALGGRQSSKILNNQLIVNRSGMGDIRAEARWGEGAWGDTVQLFGVANQMTKIIII